MYRDIKRAARELSLSLSLCVFISIDASLRTTLLRALRNPESVGVGVQVELVVAVVSFGVVQGVTRWYFPV